MTDPKGSLVVDEHVLPIVDLYLDRGALFCAAQIQGPKPAVDAVGWVIHDRSGGVFCRSQHPLARVQFGPLPAGRVEVLTVQLDIVGKVTEPPTRTIDDVWPPALGPKPWTGLPA